MSKLPGSFKEYGDRSTAGNSSQVTDGAAALLLMKRSKALELGQPILGKYVATALAGLPPRIMGIGPSLAIPKLLKKLDLNLKKDIDVIEINEAFASMAVYCRDKLELNWDVMNPRGGAIALGHPFGKITPCLRTPIPFLMMIILTSARYDRCKTDRDRSE